MTAVMLKAYAHRRDLKAGAPEPKATMLVAEHEAFTGDHSRQTLRPKSMIAYVHARPAPSEMLALITLGRQIPRACVTPGAQYPYQR
jgi:hypothetical protein